MGMFMSPNTASIMNSVPPEHRGVASGMRSTLQNVGQLVSLVLFFGIVITALENEPTGDAGISHGQCRCTSTGRVACHYLAYRGAVRRIPRL